MPTLNPDTVFHVPATEYNAAQTYTRDELAEELGISTDKMTDVRAKRVAEIFAANIDGDGRFSFNDCETEMKQELLNEMIV